MTGRTLMLLLLLAGCARGPTPGDACDRAVYDDPTVRRIMMVQAGTASTQFDIDRASLRQAKEDARLRCLHARGLAPPGGVAPRRAGPEEHTLW